MLGQRAGRAVPSGRRSASIGARLWHGVLNDARLRGALFDCTAVALALLCMLQAWSLWQAAPAWFPAAIAIELAPGAGVTLGRHELAAPQADRDHIAVRRDADGSWWLRNLSEAKQVLLQDGAGERRMGGVALQAGQRFQVGATRFTVDRADGGDINFAGAGHHWRYDGALLYRDGEPQAPCPDTTLAARAAARWNRAMPAPLTARRSLTVGGNLDCGNRLGVAGVGPGSALLNRADGAFQLNAGAPDGERAALLLYRAGVALDLRRQEQALTQVRAMVVGHTRFQLALEGARLVLTPSRRVALYAAPELRLPPGLSWQWRQRALWSADTHPALWLGLGLALAAMTAGPFIPHGAAWGTGGATLAAGALLACGVAALILQRAGHPPPAAWSAGAGCLALWMLLSGPGRTAPGRAASGPAAPRGSAPERNGADGSNLNGGGARFTGGDARAPEAARRTAAGPAIVFRHKRESRPARPDPLPLATAAAVLLLAVGLLAQLELGLGGMESSWLRYYQKSTALLAIGAGLAGLWQPWRARARAVPRQREIEWAMAALAAVALTALAMQVLWGDETGVFDLQPVEVAKLALTVLSAHCLALRLGWHADCRQLGPAQHGRRWLRLIAPALLFLALLGVALVQVDDYSPLILLLVWSTAMAFAYALAIGNRALAAGVAGVALAGAGAIAWLHAGGAGDAPGWPLNGGFYADRFLVWLDPVRHPHTGQQWLLGARAIADGGWWGADQTLGLGRLGRAAGGALAIPAVQDDFAPAFFINRHGLVGALLLWACQAAFISGLLATALRAHGAAARARDFRHAWLCRFRYFVLCGGAAFVLGHLLLSWGTNLGIFPIMGQPMSFLSAGGSHLLFFLCPLLGFAGASAPSFEEK